MALRTQVDPNVLIGDSLADLPLPGAQKQGLLFHSILELECRILVIDDVTGERRWEEFCAGGSGMSGPAGPTGAIGPAGPTGPTGGVDRVVYGDWQANSVTVGTTGPILNLGALPNLPDLEVPRTGSVTGLTVAISSVVPGGNALHATVLIDDVPTAMVATLGPGAATGSIVAAPGVFPVLSTQTLGVRLTSTSPISEINANVEIEVTNT